MIKLLKKEIPPFMVLLVFFLISILALLTLLGLTQHKLKQKENYVKVALKEAIRSGANKDSLKIKLAKSDTLK
jgi:hypothetical protein